MNFKLYSVAIGVVTLMCKPHLTLAPHGMSLTVPLILVAAVGVFGTCLLLAVLIARNMHHCYPYPRTVT